MILWSTDLDDGPIPPANARLRSALDGARAELGRGSLTSPRIAAAVRRSWAAEAAEMCRADGRGRYLALQSPRRYQPGGEGPARATLGVYFTGFGRLTDRLVEFHATPDGDGSWTLLAFARDEDGLGVASYGGGHCTRDEVVDVAIHLAEAGAMDLWDWLARTADEWLARRLRKAGGLSATRRSRR